MDEKELNRDTKDCISYEGCSKYNYKGYDMCKCVRQSIDDKKYDCYFKEVKNAD